MALPKHRVARNLSKMEGGESGYWEDDVGELEGEAEVFLAPIHQATKTDQKRNDDQSETISDEQEQLIRKAVTEVPTKKVK